MRKLLTAGVTAFLVVVFAGSVQATPLSASGALATSGAIRQSLPDDGVTKVWYHRHWRHYGWYHHHWRHYGWYRGRHYGWYRWHRRYAWKNF
jgi:hypothetical protein